MSRFWDNWAQANRSARAWGLAIFLSAWLAYAWIANPGEPTSVTRQSAELIEVIENRTTEGRSRGAATWIGRVRLADGGEARVYLQRPLSQPGDPLPVRVETYADGKRRVSLDSQRWSRY